MFGHLPYSKICSLSLHPRLMCGQLVEEARCSQTGSPPQPPRDCPPLILSHFSRAQPPTEQLNQGCFIYDFNNGVSWENFGFSIPRSEKSSTECSWNFLLFTFFFLLPQSLSHLNRVSNIPSQKKDNLNWCSFGWYVLYQTGTVSGMEDIGW